MRNEDWRAIGDAPGPFASVCFDVSHDTEDAAERTELIWQAVREELDAREADDASVATLDRAVHADRPVVGRGGRALVAAGDRLLVDETLPTPPPTPIVRFGERPYLVPLVWLGDPPVPYVAVVTDRIGAHLRAVDAHGRVVAAPEVHGSDHPVHAVGGGGWAHYNLRSRAEETVRRNIREITDRVTRLADLVGARLLVLGGEVQGRSAVRDTLPPRYRDLAVEITVPTRGEDADLDAHLGEIEALLTARRAAERRAALDRFGEARAHGRAAAGLADVTAALRTGQVDTLLVTDPLLADRTVWAGPEPTEIAVEPGDPAVSDGAQTRADEALPFAAVATGADLLVVTDDAADFVDGVAALLRYP